MTRSSSAFRLGIVTGMVSEARCLNGIDAEGRVAVRVAGADPGRAEAAARELVRDGATALLSFGLAGGLHPSHGTGAAIVAERVYAWHKDFALTARRDVRTRLNELFSLRDSNQIGDLSPEDDQPVDAEYSVDPTLSQALLDGIGRRAVIAPIVGVDRPVMTLAEKQGLFMRTLAAAADMESHAVAAVAQQEGVPFAVLRVVLDPSNRTLPSSALDSLRPDGSSSPGAALAAVAKRPWEIVSLLTLAVETGVALRALRRVGRRGLPRLLRSL